VRALGPALAALSLALAAAAPARAQVSISSAPRRITLAEAYDLALKRSELLAQDQQAVAQALARVDELKSDILPHLAFIGQQTFQQNPNGPNTQINHTSIPNYFITAQQPLFSGFREFLAFKAGKKTAEALRMTERRAESLLYQDVAQSFLNLEQVQRDIDIRGAVLKATAERISQLEHWVKIGRSRESEVLAARSLLAQTQAQVEIERGSERIYQETLRFLTGEDTDFTPVPVPVPELQPMEPFLDLARRRDDVQSSERSLEAARLNTSIARRQRWGSIGLTADYYLKRQGFSANTHYDAVIGLNIPIWDGGVISAQTKEAKAQEKSAEYALSAAQRAAERDARAAYMNLQWSLSAVQALQKADDLASANVKAQENDYRLSLVTNLEVLDSLTALQNTRLQLNSARHQAAFARAQLEVAAGGPQRRPAGGK
jgi:outer membrane protein